MACKKELSNNLKLLIVKLFKRGISQRKIAQSVNSTLDVLKVLFAIFGRNVAQKMMQEISLEAVVYD